MKKNLNIVVSGMSVMMVNQLKTAIISSLPKDAEVHWVNLSEPHIDVILVNEMFFDSSSIQTILSNHNASYLCLIKANNNGGEIIGNTLSCPVEDIEPLKQWLHNCCLNGTAVIKSPVVVESTTKTVCDDITDIFNVVFTPNNGFRQISDANGFLALIDTSTNRIWLNSGISTLRFDNTINQADAAPQFVQDILQQECTEDLYVGLWRVLDRSITLNFPQVELGQYFKLDIWPQLPAGTVRKDLFKLSACFSHGANIQKVADYLGLSHQRVLHFVAIASLLRMGQVITPLDSKFMLSQQNSTKEPKSNKISSFLGKLRKKLGL
jgi:hypothetical protein